MTTLSQFIAIHDLDPIWVMNELQEAGIVSDDAITFLEVPEADHARAIQFLWDKIKPDKKAKKFK